ncbi:hypothetical protein HdyHp2_110 [Haloarcula virus Hardyhisp2]|uniref:Uncharacterized protein n=1 Tax=Haloarcula virus Hardyhisp2 TaxID=2811386 RepID=A0A898KA43_9VIRU|nr:hypothetical protein QIT44_gp22 [Haloarcula virus Hardyhisp2]QSJ05042.1 hypothetical protein HdyHp2_110 [Haloarcula virus Hardyhisp2]
MSEETEESASIDINELSEEQIEALTANPEVQKMLRYEETAIPQVASMVENLVNSDEGTEESEAYDLLVSGIAERSGRVTESTVRKVLSNLPEEFNSVK